MGKCFNKNHATAPFVVAKPLSNGMGSFGDPGDGIPLLSFIPGIKHRVDPKTECCACNAIQCHVDTKNVCRECASFQTKKYSVVGNMYLSYVIQYCVSII